MFDKILIANRGEIACRIIKTAREMGILTVAVYSEADATAPHVRLADESYCIGPPQAAQSYLRKDLILDIAKKSKSDAIHPGYGFLSENADFAELVTASGIIFIGPSADSMRKMGDKTSARQMAKEVGIPMVEGALEPLADSKAARKVADKIGYPVLIKASAGGGGKGMRVVRVPEELDSSFSMAQSEAKSAFGDDRVYMEKYLENPRHIEVQIMADTHGNAIHLGERECSIQRRHQKIVEESPSVAVDDVLREKMTRDAIRLVMHSKYVNAGTLEFLVDAQKNYYFLEMNTRLQVEHPVTEMRIRLDLVREQIRVAEGLPLRFKQEEINFRGHAIECRIYAEDSFNNFFPSTGTIHCLRSSFGAYTREDRGIEEGGEISTYYDPMISKLITYGYTREDALNRMSLALRSYEIYGVHTNISLCRWIVDHPKFRSGDFSTSFLPTHFSVDALPKPSDEELLVAALVAVTSRGSGFTPRVQPGGGSAYAPASVPSRWKHQRLKEGR